MYPQTQLSVSRYCTNSPGSAPVKHSEMLTSHLYLARIIFEWQKKKNKAEKQDPQELAYSGIDTGNP